MPQGISQDDLSVSRSWDFVLLIENVWQVRNVASLDAYQIINYQFLSKTHHFFLPDSEEFEKKFLNEEFYGQLPEQT